MYLNFFTKVGPAVNFANWTASEIFLVPNKNISSTLRRGCFNGVESIIYWAVAGRESAVYIWEKTLSCVCVRREQHVQCVPVEIKYAKACLQRDKRGEQIALCLPTSLCSGWTRAWWSAFLAARLYAKRLIHGPSLFTRGYTLHCIWTLVLSRIACDGCIRELRATTQKSQELALHFSQTWFFLLSRPDFHLQL